MWTRVKYSASSAMTIAIFYLIALDKHQVITQINPELAAKTKITQPINNTVYLDTLMYPEAIASHIISRKKGIINVYGVDATWSRQTRYK